MGELVYASCLQHIGDIPESVGHLRCANWFLVRDFVYAGLSDLWATGDVLVGDELWAGCFDVKLVVMEGFDGSFGSDAGWQRGGHNSRWSHRDGIEGFSTD